MTVEVSFIVPVYNQANNIDRLYESIKMQGLRDYEVVFIDDGSTDLSSEVIRKIITRDASVKLISQENSGLSVARNVGLASVEGDYVIFLDGDDFYITGNVLSGFLQKMKFNNYDLGIFGYSMVTPEGDLIRKKRVSGSIEKNFSGVWNKVYQRTILNGVEFPKGAFFEDIEVSARIRARAKSVLITQDSLYGYVQRENSIVQRNGSKKHADAFMLLNNLVNAQWLQKRNHKFQLAEATYVVSHLFNHSIVVSQYDEISEETYNAWTTTVQNVEEWISTLNVDAKTEMKIKVSKMLARKPNSFFSHIVTFLGNKYRKKFRR